MAERTHQTSAQHTPVVEDANATAAQLQQRAAVDYAEAQARREQQASQDRVNGNQMGRR